MSTLYLGNAYLRKRAANNTKVMHSLRTDDIQGAQPRRTIRRGRRKADVYQRYIIRLAIHFIHSLQYVPTYQASYVSPNEQIDEYRKLNDLKEHKSGYNQQQMQQSQLQDDQRQLERYNQDRQQPQQDPYLNQPESPYIPPQPKMRNPLFANYDYTNAPQYQPRNKMKDSLDRFQDEQQKRLKYGEEQFIQPQIKQPNLQDIPIDRSQQVQEFKNIQPRSRDKRKLVLGSREHRQVQEQKQQSQQETQQRKDQKGQVVDQYQQNLSNFYGTKIQPNQTQNPQLEDNAHKFYGSTVKPQKEDTSQNQDYKKNQSAFYMGSPQRQQGSRQRRKVPYSNQSRQEQQYQNYRIRRLRKYNPISHTTFADYRTNLPVIRGRYDYDIQYQKNADRFYDVDRVPEKHKIRGRIQARSLNPDFVSENMSYGQQRRIYV